MIDKYSMFHVRNKKTDTLVVVFNYGKIATRYERIGDIGITYSDKEIIAYNFFNINKIVKIRANNMIFLPNEALIDVLNALLGKKFTHLSYKMDSGFMITGCNDISKINEKESLYYLITGPKSLITCVLPNDVVKVGTYFVLASEGTMLPNGEIVKKGHACTGYDLGINDDKTRVYELDDLYTLGSDFFRMEEN